MKRLLLLVALVLALPTAARAHGDTGTLELVSEESVSGGIEYVVRLAYANDGEPVSSAEVTVSVDGAAPSVMTAEGDGRYAATVPFPESGQHTIRFAAADPEAALDIQVVAASSADPTTTTDAPNVAEEPLPDPDAAGGSSAWLLVLMAIIVVVMVVLAVAFVRGRRPRP